MFISQKVYDERFLFHFVVVRMGRGSNGDGGVDDGDGGGGDGHSLVFTVVVTRISY